MRLAWSSQQTFRTPGGPLVVRSNAPALIEEILGPAADATDERGAGEVDGANLPLHVFCGERSGYYVACDDRLWNRSRGRAEFELALLQAVERLLLRRLKPELRLAGRMTEVAGRRRLELIVPAGRSCPLLPVVRGGAAPALYVVARTPEAAERVLTDRLALRFVAVDEMQAEEIELVEEAWCGRDWQPLPEARSVSIDGLSGLRGLLSAPVGFADTPALGLDVLVRLFSGVRVRWWGGGEPPANLCAPPPLSPFPPRSRRARGEELPDLTSASVRRAEAAERARALRFPRCAAGLHVRELGDHRLVAVPDSLGGHSTFVLDALSCAVLSLCDGETSAEMIGTELGRAIGWASAAGNERVRALLEGWSSHGLIEARRSAEPATVRTG